jgi:hypothetical protein
MKSRLLFILFLLLPATCLAADDLFDIKPIADGVSSTLSATLPKSRSKTVPDEQLAPAARIYAALTRMAPRCTGDRNLFCIRHYGAMVRHHPS